MHKYKEIHLIDFPKVTAIMLEDNFRKKMIRKFIDSCISWKKAADYLNSKRKYYAIRTNSKSTNPFMEVQKNWRNKTTYTKFIKQQKTNFKRTKNKI
jgi:hypothetical protein